MDNLKELVNKFRYTVFAVLVVLTVGYGYYLYTLYFPAEPTQPASIAVTAVAGGGVRIDGETFTSAESLKTKVTSLQQEHPGAGFEIKAPAGQDFNDVAKAVVLLRDSGANTIWVLNETKGPAGKE